MHALIRGLGRDFAEYGKVLKTGNGGAARRWKPARGRRKEVGDDTVPRGPTCQRKKEKEMNGRV